jgi:hypothetical protein
VSHGKADFARKAAFVATIITQVEQPEFLINIDDQLQEAFDAAIKIYRSACLEALKNISSEKVNPYLYVLRGSNQESLVRDIVNSKFSAAEETLLGKLLESITVKILCRFCKNVKSSSKGLDGDFVRKNTRYFFSCKSGPNWGNGSSTAAQGQEFSDAKKLARGSDSLGESFVSVMLILYSNVNRLMHYADVELTGQQAWTFITGDREFYLKLVNIFKKGASEFGRQLELSKMEAISRLCEKLASQGYITDDKMANWDKFVKDSCGNL